MSGKVKVIVPMILLSAMVLVAGLSTLSTAQREKKEPVIVKSQNDFATTYNTLKKAITDDGLMIVAEANHKNMLALIGEESPPSITIMFGRPQMGAGLLKMKPECALDMPLRMCVRENPNGDVIVAYYRPSYLFSHYGSKEITEMVAKMADPMFEKWVKAATAK